jgi:N-acetyl-anhydromuramyl-L-alanine amidase AmpD
MSDTSAEARGCLYDGSAKPATLTKAELKEVTSLLPPDTKDPGFSVITSIRSANFSRDRQMTRPLGIVLHHTGGSFEGDLATLTRAGTEVSSNDYIDKRGRIFELCEFPKRAWHAGESELHGISDWNSHGWGIEIENLGNGSDPYPPRQIDAIVWRCRERRRALGVTQPRLLARHRDVAVPRGRKSDTSDNFPFQEVRRRVFAPTDPTDSGRPPSGGLSLEKYNVAGLGDQDGLIAAAFAAALRVDGVKAMAVHSAANVQAAASEAAVAKFRKGPRLVAIGQAADNAVKKAGHRLGTEEKSDLFGAVGRGATRDERARDTIAQALDLLAQIAATERKNSEDATNHFKKTLVALSDSFQDKL